MQTYQIVTQEEKVLPILNELHNILDFKISQTGEVVEINKIGQGITLTKKDGKRILTYGKDHEFSRAWYRMLSMEDQQEYEYQEACSFEQLQVMVDCSRNAVMTKEALKEYIRYLAACGYHSLQLYTEDTIQVKKEPYFGYMRGAYTKEEIQEIDSYLNIFGMELVPCIQTLAHINQITRYDRYQPIIDVNDILLVEEEATYEFLEHLIASVADAFSCRKINIGMDEAHMLGLGKYLDKHGYQERFQLMTKHLNRVLEILHKYQFEPMMWSDMFFRLLSNGEYELTKDQINSELFELIPKGVQLVYWDYYSMDYKHYSENLKMHRHMSESIGFAAGAWKWTGFAPENGYSLKAGEQSIKACIDHKITNFIVTCWGDNGAEASNFSVLPCLYQYADSAYRQVPMNPTTKEERARRNRDFKVLTGLTFDEFMLMDAPNQIFKSLQHCHSNACKYLLYNDVLLGTFDSLVTNDVKAQYEQKAKELEVVISKDTSFSYLFETLQSLCVVLSKKADLGVRIEQAYKNKEKQKMKEIVSKTIPEVLTSLEQFQKKFWYQWQREQKPFGFEIQLIRLGGVKERLLFTKERLEQWLEGGIEQVEELEGERLPFAYYDETEASNVNYNLWSNIVSPAVIG